MYKSYTQLNSKKKKKKKTLIKMDREGLPWWSSGWDFTFQCGELGVQAPSLIGGLGSHVPCSQKTKN